MTSRKCSIDFETRSEIDLTRAGAYVYHAHESTRVLCMAYSFDDAAPALWRPGLPFPGEVIAHVRDGGTVAAHNAAFELGAWNGPLCKQLLLCSHGLCDNNCQHSSGHKCGYGPSHCAVCFPALAPEQCDCTMARAAALSLPLKLDQLAPALKLNIAKDIRGRYLINKLCKPQRRRDGSWYWNDDAALLQEMYAYCVRDVEVEQAVARQLMPLSPAEHKLWCLDQRINARGVRVDLDSVSKALAIADAEGARSALEVSELTGGTVGSGAQVAKLRGWLAARGIETKKLTKTQVTALIRDNPDAAPDVRRILELRQESSKASVAKLRAMQKCAVVDGRVRGLFQYHGAGTGRWAGRLVQLQNMPRSPDEFTPVVARMLIDSLAHPRAAEFIRAAFGPPMEYISYGIRPMLTAADGYEFHACDFSNIEGRVLAWLASEEWKLKAFREYDAGIGHDLYKLAYAKSFGIDPSAVTKAQRQLGKVQELALGFGGGIGAFASMAANYGIWVGEKLEEAPPDAAQKISHGQADEIKKAWRQAHPATTALWWELDASARQAIEHPGETAYAAGGKIAYRMYQHFLLCRLPSGRVIAYPFARIEPAHTFETRHKLSAAKARVRELEKDKRPDTDATLIKWRAIVGELSAEPKPDSQITYEGANPMTKQWGAETTYGGKLSENCLAGETLVVTDTGTKRLDTISAGDRVWDGVEFVSHGGTVCNGYLSCVELDGVAMTPDHRVLTSRGWLNASSCAGIDRHPVALPYSGKVREQQWTQIVLGSALRLRRYKTYGRVRIQERQGKIVRVPAAQAHWRSATDARHELPSGVCCMAVDDRSLPVANAPSVEKLRRPRYFGLPGMGWEFRRVLAGHGTDIRGGAFAGTQGQQRQLLPVELRMGNNEAPSAKQARQPILRDAGRGNAGLRSFRAVRYRRDNAALSHVEKRDARPISVKAGPNATVWDIVNCGPRNRFVILTDAGPLIVHNCTQAVARDVLAESMFRLEAAGYPIVLHVHDENVCEMPRGKGSIDEMARIMSVPPAWCSSLPIAVDGWTGDRYRK